MNRFVMELDERSQEYLKSIRNEMIKMFSIPDDEAYGRINRFWNNEVFHGNQLMLYHEDEIYWANTIYYGKNSFWWLREGEYIEPIPYP